MAKSDKRRLREVRYTDKRRLRGVVFLSGPQQYMWYAEVLIKTCNEAGKRACETPDRTFYDAIKLHYEHKGIRHLQYSFLDRHLQLHMN